MEKTNFVIKLAGINIAISCNFERTRDFCKDYLTKDNPQIKIELNKQDLIDEAKHQKNHIKQCPTWYLEELALYRKIATQLLKHNILLYHGSAIEADGNAYIFTAKSGTGKSTHSKFWREYLSDAKMINDDKPLIKVGKEKSKVYGTPWDGKHKLSENISAPLKAICIIRQADKNEIMRINKSDSLPTMLQQTFMPEDAESTKKILELIEQMLKNVEVYKLKCLPNVDAAKLAYETMKK